MTSIGRPKRHRKPNFTEQEKMIVLEEFEKCRNILHARSCDGVTTDRKQAAWQSIAEKLNSYNKAVKRTGDDIRSKWKKMINEAKKEAVQRKRKMPNSNRPLPPISTISQRIIDMYSDSPSFAGLADNDSNPDMKLKFLKLLWDESDKEDNNEDAEDETSVEDHRVVSTTSSPRKSNNSVYHADEPPAASSSYCPTSWPTPVIDSISSLSVVQNGRGLQHHKQLSEDDVHSLQLEVLKMEKEKLIMEMRVLAKKEEKLDLEMNYWRHKNILIQSASDM
ncbi:myb/SANT-like DNA-binding domain-containing protein 4 [Centruroides vittatus]|uniref:myb/SANT-like DNA-binding domain-containing protein 4 n=1 Tax=Centruroides sculpturatus TaxID=218467 RepID=UPI000C6D7103|nr:myb/SANT-like DNA-binding domain-containing protein 4 [Centruroides sculpturatus]